MTAARSIHSRRDASVRAAQRRSEAQAALACLLGHPRQRRERQAVVRIPAADVGVHAGEPHLRDPLLVDVRRRGVLRLLVLGPQQREERLALVVQGQRVTRALDAGRRPPVLGQHRPDPPFPPARQFVDRQPVRRHRVPHAEELDVHLPGAVRIEQRLATHAVPRAQHHVADPAAQPHRPRVRKAVGAIGAIRPQGQPPQFGLRVGLDQPDPADQRGQDAGRVRAAAEPEREDAIVHGRIVRIGAIGPAQEHVEVEDVALQAVAERAAEDRDRLERRRCRRHRRTARPGPPMSGPAPRTDARRWSSAAWPRCCRCRPTARPGSVA